MRTLFVITVLLFLSMASSGQVGTTFANAPQIGISMAHLDSIGFRRS